MSATARAAIAAAASSVAGVTVTPYFRQSTSPGEGMVRLDRQVRSENGFGFVNVWQVVIMLPQDIEAAEKQLETWGPALVTALSQELVVTSVAPQQLALDTGLVPCVFIQGNREEE